MSVHRAISEHSKRQFAALQRFKELDQLRETYIEDAVNKCKNNQDFDVRLINQVTQEINELAKKEIVPTRKLVTKEMVKEYVTRLTQEKM